MPPELLSADGGECDAPLHHKRKKKEDVTERLVFVCCSSCLRGKRFETQQFLQTTEWNLFTGIVGAKATKGRRSNTADNNPTSTDGKQKRKLLLARL